MFTCRICMRLFRNLRFDTEHMQICHFCVTDLNEWRELACFAEGRLGELLRKGMARRNPNYQEEEFRLSRPGWLNGLLADKENRGRDFRILRAYRRGMLRHTGLTRWEYPSNWIQQAQNVRKRDGCCHACGELAIRLDVHHIIYLSNWGTNQQSNLVALCRPCHEQLHGREFDLGEAEDPQKQKSP